MVRSTIFSAGQAGAPAKGTSMPGIRPLASAAIAVCALMLLTASPASADPPPQPPGPASLPALTVPGEPTLDSTDSRGTNGDTMADEDQTLVGMPGSRLGNAPFRISQVGPTNGVRTTTGTEGVGVGSTNLAGGLEDPRGNPPPLPMAGNAGTYVETPPIPGARLMMVVRLAAWWWSIGWLADGASAFPDGNALGTWISVCCFGTGVVVDGLLTADNASPVGDDMAPFLVPAGGEGVSRIEHGRTRQGDGRERRPHLPLLREKEAKNDGAN